MVDEKQPTGEVETEEHEKPASDKLWLYVLIGLVGGVIVGVLLGPDFELVERGLSTMIASWLALPGQLFLQIILFVVVPLIISSVALAIAGDNQDYSAIQKLGGSVIVYFVITTTIAVTIAIFLTSLFQPGMLIDRSYVDAQISATEAVESVLGGGGSLPETIVSLFPRNLFNSIVEGNMLQVVIASAIFGLALLAIPHKESKPLVDLLASIQSSSIKIVTWLMKFAPIAVFGLLASALQNIGLSAVFAVGAYVGTFIAVMISLVIVYMLILATLGGRNPFRFLSLAREPMIIAFSTSSSSATMPVTLRVADQKLGINRTVRRLVIPLGTTINMDGTAAYQAVVVVFLAQVFNIPLGIPEMITLIALSVGASIGAPGIPGGVIAILTGILVSIGIPEAGIALILAVDRLLDMIRTTVNVTGDMVTSIVLERLLGFKPDTAEALQPGE